VPRALSKAIFALSKGASAESYSAKASLLSFVLTLGKTLGKFLIKNSKIIEIFLIWGDPIGYRPPISIQVASHGIFGTKYATTRPVRFKVVTSISRISLPNHCICITL